MNEQTIEMQIHAKAQEALQSLNKLTSQLTGVEKKIDGVKTTIDKVSTTKAKNEMNSLNSSIEKASKSMEKFKNLFTFVGVKRLTKTALGWMNEAIDYTEQLNLFNVVFDNAEKNGKTMYSNLGKEAIKYQNKLNEAFGTNKTQTLYMHGIYQSMGENVGIGDKYAGIMSETMTKLTYDLASLYNKSEKDTAEAIRAGVYAGQTKPLRSFGIDVTQMSMQPILDSLGIDEQVKNMSQAEKEILRYLATLNQAKVAMGDLANTIESPSNQLKIFRQQLVEAKVAMSSLFIGGLANILPYANAFLMVVKEVSKAIADMFGIKLIDYNSGIASQEDAFVDLGDSVDDAIGKVKELKRQTLGFDEIHNINENKDSGSGTSISGGIDQRLLDAIKGYDNGMDSVNMKAKQIKRSIMKWLGFTEHTNEETGETWYTYDGIDETLKNMWESFKGLSTQGQILVGLGLVTGAVKLWNAGKKLVNIFGNSGLVKVIKSLYSPTKNLFSCMLLGLKGSHSSLKTGIQSWREQMGIIDENTGKVDGLKGVLKGAKTAMKGLITSAVGLYTVHESMKNLSTEGFNLANALGLVGGSLTTIASGVQIGAIFGSWGAVIGGAVGAIGSLITALTTCGTSTKDVIDNTKEYEKALDRLDETARNTMETSLVQLDRNDELVNSLSDLVDSNGKVKKGYEDRVNYILNELNNAYGTEYKLVDNQITKNGDEATSLQSVQDEIKNKIKWLRMEAIAEAYKEDYISALKDEKKYQEEINKENEMYNQKLQSIEETAKELREKWENNKISTEEYNISLLKLNDAHRKVNDEHTKSLDDLNSKYNDSEKIINNYEEFQSAILAKDYRTALNLSGNYIDNTKLKTDYLQETLTDSSKTTKEKLESIFGNVPKKISIKVEGLTTKFDSAVDKIKNLKLSKTVSVDADTSKAMSSVNSFLSKISGGAIGTVLGNVLKTKELGGIYSNGTWKNIPQYANGGAPSHGSMFVAGEHGAEIVGHINGKTEVLNQSQIASSIYSAVVSAVTQVMSQYGGQASEIDVHVHTDEGTVIDRIEQRTKQTGQFPFTIPIY